MFVHDTDECRDIAAFVQVHLHQKIEAKACRHIIGLKVGSEIEILTVDELALNAGDELVFVEQSFQLTLVGNQVNSILRHSSASFS
ncbi:hypothetical protein D3C87_1472730 [compost metagenome]